MIVYNGKLYITADSTNYTMTDTGAKIYVYDGRGMGRLRKGFTGFTDNDRSGRGMAIYKGKLYIGTDNSTVATDLTAAKIVSMKVGLNESNNNYTQRGF
jgi:hypothetical protein